MFGPSDQLDSLHNETPAEDLRQVSQPNQSQLSHNEDLFKIGDWVRLKADIHVEDGVLADIRVTHEENPQRGFHSSSLPVLQAARSELGPALGSTGGPTQEVDTTVDLESFRNGVLCKLAGNPPPEWVSQLLGYLDCLRNEVNEHASASQSEPKPLSAKLAKKTLDRTLRYYRCHERDCGTEVQLRNTFKRHLQDMHYHDVDYYCHHEGCRTNRQPFHRRDKIRNHHRMTHGASSEEVPWNEINQRKISYACPPVCAVCFLSVPDWSSFYECYADHCEIIPAPPKPGSSCQGNHGRGNKRRRPDSDDSDDDGEDNGGPASSKKGSRRAGNAARQSQHLHGWRNGASQPVQQRSASDTCDGRTMAAQDHHMNVIHPITSILQPSEPGSDQQWRIRQEPRRPQFDPRNSQGQDAPQPSVRQCRYCNHILDPIFCTACYRSDRLTPWCHNCTPAQRAQAEQGINFQNRALGSSYTSGQAVRLTRAQSNLQTSFGARMGPTMAPPNHNLSGQIAQRPQQPNHLSTQQVHTQGAHSNTQRNLFGGSGSYTVRAVQDVLVHGMSELEIESSSFESKGKLDSKSRGSSVWSIVLPFRGSPPTRKHVMGTTTIPADGKQTPFRVLPLLHLLFKAIHYYRFANSTGIQAVTQQFIGPPTLTQVNPSSGCQCNCRTRSQESYFARSRVDMAPGRRIEVDFKMAPEARGTSHLLRTRVQVVVKMLRLRSSVARSANGKHKTEAHAAIKEALEATLDGIETKTMTSHDQAKVTDLDIPEYDSDVESVTDSIFSENSRASSCTDLTEFSTSSSPLAWATSETSFSSDLELPPSARSSSPFDMDWDVDTLCSEEQVAHDIELFEEEEKELELTFDLDLRSSLDKLARCTNVLTEDLCSDQTSDLLILDPDRVAEYLTKYLRFVMFSLARSRGEQP